MAAEVIACECCGAILGAGDPARRVARSYGWEEGVVDGEEVWTCPPCTAMLDSVLKEMGGYDEG